MRELVQVSSSTRSNVYTLKISALSDVEINTVDALSLGKRGELHLVHPWIRDRLGQVYQQGWADSSDNDSDADQSPLSPKMEGENARALNLLVHL